MQVVAYGDRGARIKINTLAPVSIQPWYVIVPAAPRNPGHRPLGRIRFGQPVMVDECHVVADVFVMYRPIRGAKPQNVAAFATQPVQGLGRPPIAG